MDGESFDALLRTLLSSPSRRGVLAGLVSGLLAGVPLVRMGDDTAAKKNRRGKKKCKGNKKKCGRKCKGGTEKCGKTCVAKCAAGEARNPLTCGCCLANGTFCATTPAGNCCAGSCAFTVCAGLAADQPCEFDAQCHTGECDNGTCTGLATGQPCQLPGQCDSGSCNGGICA